jgi:hypothetical protein
MSSKSLIPKFFSHVLIALILPLLIAACAEFRVNTIPSPPPSAKLRVFLLPISGVPPHGTWPFPHEEWAQFQVMSVGKLLEKTGIYELATREEIARVVGPKTPSHGDLSRKDWALLREIGGALHADYAMVMERNIFGPSRDQFFETVLINVETGRRFRVGTRVQIASSPREEFRRMEVIAYDEIFRDARNDILAVAMRKGRLASPGFFDGQPAMPEKSVPPTGTGPVSKPTETRPAKPAASSTPPSGGKPPTPQEIVREVDLAKVLAAESAMRGRERLAVYSFESPAPYRVISLILAEALRQEIFNIGIFDLVNREDMAKVSEEMSLQQTGFVDEKGAVKAGKGLAVRQIVTGQFGTLGKSAILQIKRVDLETQKSLGFAVLKCQIGKEEELLQKMPDLARDLLRQR